MFDEVIRFGVDILTSTVSKATNKILLQTGNVVGEDADTDNVELWQQVGWASRPSKPTKGKAAAQAITMQRGNRDVCIATQDVRCLEIYGNLKPGETAAFAAGEDGLSQGRTLWKDDGSITHYTTHNNRADGRSVYTRTAPDGIEWVAPWGTLRFDATGFHVRHISGAEFHLGGIGGLPFPLDQLNSYVSMSAGMIKQSAAIQSNGIGGGSSLASASGVLEAISALQVEIAAVAAALNAAMAIPGVIKQEHITAASAATSAVGVATGLLEPLKQTIPTTTTSS